MLAEDSGSYQGEGMGVSYLEFEFEAGIAAVEGFG